MFSCNVTLCVALLFCYAVNGWRIPSKDAYEIARATYEDLENEIEDHHARTNNDVINKKDLEIKLKDLPADNELFEDDIIMDSRLRNAVLGVSKKSVVADDDIKWPNNTLYYEIEDGFGKDKDGNMVEGALELLLKGIEEFRKRTCINMVERTNEPDYVVYSSRLDECSSSIGRIGGKQMIHIGIHCLVLGTVLHETMHALGFIHEHSRPDRDDYLDVKWENIDKDEWANFNKYNFGDVKDENVEYNFASVMHYRNDAFTKNGEDTLIAIGEENFKFGQRIKFSVGDVKGINRFYGCTNELENPKYNGLFKDYAGAKRDARKKKRLGMEKLKRFIAKNSFFDSPRPKKPGYFF